MPTRRDASFLLELGGAGGGTADSTKSAPEASAYTAVMASEVSALKGQMRARVTLLACDSSLAEGAPWVFEPWEEFRCPTEIHGGGGTDFRPVFEWLADHDQRPELLVYFTDAQGRFPEHEPNFPVIWLVKGKDSVPWGQRVQLN